METLAHHSPESIDHFERWVADERVPQVECPLKHFFSEGVYARECRIPAGTLLTGKIHRHRHNLLLTEGTVSFFDEADGKPGRKMTAPQVAISLPGARRLIYAHTDCAFITIHDNPDNLTDIAELENRLVITTDAVKEIEARKQELIA